MIPGGHLGARAPQRQPLSRKPRPVTALLPVADPAATQPALPAVIVPVIEPQTPAWRERAARIAWETGWLCQATPNGRSPRGLAIYAVPSASRSHVTYHVRFTPHAGAVTIHDGVYICDCQAAQHGYPCRHVGAALYTAQAEAETRECVALADQQHMGWAWATPAGGEPDEHLAWFRVGESAMSQWRYVGVAWDTARNLPLMCECGARVCAHIGAVALHVAKERADALRRARRAQERARSVDYDPDWLNVFDPLWDGSTLPVALV